MVKGIGGLDSARSIAAPSAIDITDYFADKMTSGKDREDDGFQPNNRSQVPLSSFKIRLKDIRKSLRSLDPSKSANGVGPRFLKVCADAIASPIYKLLRFIVKKAVYPTDWKVGRVTPVHKRGAVPLPAN